MSSNEQQNMEQLKLLFLTTRQDEKPEDDFFYRKINDFDEILPKPVRNYNYDKKRQYIVDYFNGVNKTLYPRTFPDDSRPSFNKITLNNEIKFIKKLKNFFFDDDDKLISLINNYITHTFIQFHIDDATESNLDKRLQFHFDENSPYFTMINDLFRDEGIIDEKNEILEDVSLIIGGTKLQHPHCDHSRVFSFFKKNKKSSPEIGFELNRKHYNDSMMSKYAHSSIIFDLSKENSGFYISVPSSYLMVSEEKNEATIKYGRIGESFPIQSKTTFISELQSGNEFEMITILVKPGCQFVGDFMHSGSEHNHKLSESDQKKFNVINGKMSTRTILEKLNDIDNLSSITRFFCKTVPKNSKLFVPTKNVHLLSEDKCDYVTQDAASMPLEEKSAIRNESKTTELSSRKQISAVRKFGNSKDIDCISSSDTEKSIMLKCRKEPKRNILHISKLNDSDSKMPAKKRKEKKTLTGNNINSVSEIIPDPKEISSISKSKPWKSDTINEQLSLDTEHSPGISHPAKPDISDISKLNDSESKNQGKQEKETLEGNNNNNVCEIIPDPEEPPKSDTTKEQLSLDTEHCPGISHEAKPDISDISKSNDTNDNVLEKITDQKKVSSISKSKTPKKEQHFLHAAHSPVKWGKTKVINLEEKKEKERVKKEKQRKQKSQEERIAIIKSDAIFFKDDVYEAIFNAFSKYFDAEGFVNSVKSGENILDRFTILSKKVNQSAHVCQRCWATGLNRPANKKNVNLITNHYWTIGLFFFDWFTCETDQVPYVSWLVVKESEYGKLGVFADRDFHKNEIIGYYCGKMYSVYTKDGLTKYAVHSKYAISDPKRGFVGSGEAVFHMGMHMVLDPSDDNLINAELTSAFFVKATRDINKGNEIFMKKMCSLEDNEEKNDDCLEDNQEKNDD